MTCPSCGGIIGRDFFNPIECAQITASMQNDVSHRAGNSNAVCQSIENNWTPAEIKPEHNVGVLVFIPAEDNHITSGMWDISNKWVLLDEYRTVEDDAPVTHWMPLPDMPKGFEANELPDWFAETMKQIIDEGKELPF